MRTWIVLTVLALGLAVPAPGRAGSPASGCVDCHARQPASIALGHSFEEWRGSSHAGHDVECSSCHGGDPRASDAETAHRGVLPASDAASRVHATKLAATCGSCHEKELEAYLKTSHAPELREKGRGANCLTCHDAMATSLPSPASLDDRCSACHAKPQRARNALAMLAAAKRRLRATRASLDAAPEPRPAWSANALERLQHLEGSYRRIALEWHTFDMAAVFDDTRDVLRLTDLLAEEVQRQAQMEAREAGQDGR